MNKKGHLLLWVAFGVLIGIGFGVFVWKSSVSNWNLVRTVQGRVSNVYYEPPNPFYPFSVGSTSVTFMSGDIIIFGGDQRELFQPNRNYQLTYDENWGDWRHMKRILTIEETT